MPIYGSHNLRWLQDDPNMFSMIGPTVNAPLYESGLERIFGEDFDSPLGHSADEVYNTRHPLIALQRILEASSNDTTSNPIMKALQRLVQQSKETPEEVTNIWKRLMSAYSSKHKHVDK